MMSLALATPESDNYSMFGYEGVAKKVSMALIYLYKKWRVLVDGKPQGLGKLDYGPIHPWVISFVKQHFALKDTLNTFDDQKRPAHACVKVITEYVRGVKSFVHKCNIVMEDPDMIGQCFGGPKKGRL